MLGSGVLAGSSAIVFGGSLLSDIKGYSVIGVGLIGGIPNRSVIHVGA
jgi:hypothetical protein